MNESLKIIVEKKVNVVELIMLAQRNCKKPLKKYNLSKSKDRKLSEEEFNIVFDAIREILYV